MDAVLTDIHDEAGLEREAVAAAHSGFVAKMAIHPAQAAIINNAFTLNESALAQARRVVDAFGTGSAGVAVLDGRMLDRPRLRAALRTLAAAP